jgi:RHS repeat-associated protein
LIRYYPYGQYRTEPTTQLTDMDFTGHRENRDIGLTYMNARYYVPAIGRFASADTIVPDPASPQSFNRYSYSFNNPVKYKDPSGHCGADDQFVWDPEKLTYVTIHSGNTDNCVQIRDDLEGLYGISITGQWTLAEMELFSEALAGLVDRLSEMGIQDAVDVFNDVWGGVRFNRARRYSNANAITKSRNRVDVHNGMFLDTRIQNGLTSYVTRSSAQVFDTVAHELAHVWDRRVGRDLSAGLQNAVEGRYQFNFLFFHWGEYTVKDFTPYLHVSSPRDYPKNPGEDFASTFAALMVDPDALSKLNGDDTRRYQYITDVVQGLNR